MVFLLGTGKAVSRLLASTPRHKRCDGNMARSKATRGLSTRAKMLGKGSWASYGGGERVCQCTYFLFFFSAS